MDPTVIDLLSQAVNHLGPSVWYKNFSFWSVAALVITAVAIFWYAWETKKLRVEAQKTNKYSSRPIIVIKRITSVISGNRREVIIRNIGKGPALNIESRISQIHPKSGYTNLRDLVENEKFNNLGTNEDQIIRRVSTIEAYLRANESGFADGVKNKHAIIFTYEDVAGFRYQTITLIGNVGGSPVIKKTITDDYSSGNLKNIL